MGGMLAAGGALRTDTALQSLLVLLPALAGMWLGQRVRDELSPAAFRRGLFTGLLALGAWLLVKNT